MSLAFDFIKQIDPFSTVMVVRKSTAVPDRIVEMLVEAGANVLGPVDTAARALLLAGQTAVHLALIEPELAGRRDGFELARLLQTTWGVPTLVLSAPARR